MSALLVVMRRRGVVSAREVERSLASLSPYSRVAASGVVSKGVLVAEAVDDVRAHRPPPLEQRQDDVIVAADAHLTARAELRCELEAGGRAVAETATDRQLVHAAFLTWGRDCVAHLQGEFAFVVWDPASTSLFAAQDQFGARELFWADTRDGVVLASRLSLVASHPGVPRELDDRAIGAYLLFGRPRDSEDGTCFRHVRRLLPAHCLVSDGSGIRTDRYWDFPFQAPMSRRADRREYVEEFRRLLSISVVDRLEDVPRAVVHLSGGLDSTSIATLAVEQRNGGGLRTELSALSAGYSSLAPDTELYYSALVARRLELPQAVVLGDDVRLARPLTLRSEPLQDFAVGLSARLAKATSAQAPLVLSGKGGDEVLTETALYRVLLHHAPVEALRLFRFLWRLQGSRPALGGYKRYVRGLVSSRGVTSVPEQFPFPAWLQPDFVAAADLAGMWREGWQVPPPERTHKTQPDIAEHISNATWNVRNDLVPAADYPMPDVTMPFADLRLLDFLFALPPAPWNRRKQLLRDAMSDSLPIEVLTRHKTPAPPFAITLLNQPEAAWVDDWPATEALQRYVCRQAVPPVYGAGTLERAVIDTRPLFLDEWLRLQGWT